MLELRESGSEEGLGTAEPPEAVAAPVEFPQTPPIPTAQSVRTAMAAPEAVASIVRCGNYIRRTVNQRGGPYIAKYDGTALCPLCSRTFERGQAMIKCYVDPVPAFRWIHIGCANEILAAHGRPTVNIV
mmetsp:Transcript_61522/g.127111  ORF Transcript_61522/g.127111 Transcript_61522/m.127111 type:complete len:129 (-) Transcript_61522:83-469(-)